MYLLVEHKLFLAFWWVKKLFWNHHVIHRPDPNGDDRGARSVRGPGAVVGLRRDSDFKRDIKLNTRVLDSNLGDSHMQYPS